MANTPAPSDDKKKVTSIVDEVENLNLELKPADVRSHMLRAFDVFIEMAENKEADIHTRFTALKGMDSFYMTLLMKDGLDETLMKVSQFNNNQNRTLDEVKRLRQKPWDEDTSTDNN